MYNKVKYKSEIKIIAIARKMKICKKKTKKSKKGDLLKKIITSVLN